MNKKLSALFALLIILSFIGYIIFDASSGSLTGSSGKETGNGEYADSWEITGMLDVSDGKLLSVAVSREGNIYVAGDSFIKAIDADNNTVWKTRTDEAITSICVSGDTIFASTNETILVVSAKGEVLNEWGPYESNSIITSVSAGGGKLAVADAGNKRVFIIGRSGEVVAMAGQSDDQFVIPSPYFDVALWDNKLFVANTGKRKIETWSPDGTLISGFGEPGTAPGAFCGCCNPSHFAVIPQGFVTAEKGINRIKILDREGRFVEFVSSKNRFIQSVPLDIASADGIRIYAANRVDSKLYIFERK